MFSYDVACINGELRYPDATVTGAFGHPGETTVVFDDAMYAKKIMKENESEEGRREACGLGGRVVARERGAHRVGVEPAGPLRLVAVAGRRGLQATAAVAWEYNTGVE